MHTETQVLMLKDPKISEEVKDEIRAGVYRPPSLAIRSDLGRTSQRPALPPYTGPTTPEALTITVPGGTATPTLLKVRGQNCLTGNLEPWSHGYVVTDPQQFAEAVQSKRGAFGQELMVAEWEVRKICPGCGDRFEYLTPSDTYGRPSRKAGGNREFCDDQCRRSAKRRRLDDMATLGTLVETLVATGPGQTVAQAVAALVGTVEAQAQRINALEMESAGHELNAMVASSRVTELERMTN